MLHMLCLCNGDQWYIVRFFQNGNYQIDRVCKEIVIHINIKGKN